MPEFAYENCQRLNAEFEGSRLLRLHVDDNEKESTLVYEHLRGNLFHFMNAYKQIPPLEVVVQIMRGIGKAVELMHGGKLLQDPLKC